jgi:hypothetical protein
MMSLFSHSARGKPLILNIQKTDRNVPKKERKNLVLKHVPVAIDPLALILSPEIYVKLHLPDPPPDFKANITAVAKKMSAVEKKAALANAKYIKEIAEISIQAMGV